MKTSVPRRGAARRAAAAAVVWMLAVFSPANAGEPIYSREIPGPFEPTYDAVKRALEEARFYVIFEANIGKNLARNAERWGEDYNRNGFEQVRSLVICNPWYANQVLNLDAAMIALCPFTVSLLHKNGATTVLFERPGAVGGGSPAADLLWEIENTITGALDGVEGR